jgi:hypothetical protein
VVSTSIADVKQHAKPRFASKRGGILRLHGGSKPQGMPGMADEYHRAEATPEQKQSLSPARCTYGHFSVNVSIR